MKNKVLKLLITTTIFTSSLHAFWGALYYATKGPSIPKVMKVHTKFNQEYDKGIIMPHLKNGEIAQSSDSSIVDVKINKKYIEFIANKPGTATITLYKTNGKIKETKTITVSYNSLKEVPAKIHAGDKIFITASAKRSESNITTNTPNLVRIIRKKIGNEYFYEIKGKTPGAATLMQNGRSLTLTIMEPSKNSKK